MSVCLCIAIHSICYYSFHSAIGFHKVMFTLRMFTFYNAYTRIQFHEIYSRDADSPSATNAFWNAIATQNRGKLVNRTGELLYLADESIASDPKGMEYLIIKIVG